MCLFGNLVLTSNRNAPKTPDKNKKPDISKLNQFSNTLLNTLTGAFTWIGSDTPAPYFNFHDIDHKSPQNLTVSAFAYFYNGTGDN
jgi:hypothetical protein